MDWEGIYGNERTNNSCSFSYHGASPFSEPETQTIRDVVMNNKVSAVMSFQVVPGAALRRPSLFTHTRLRAHSIKCQQQTLNAIKGGVTQ
jgi:hypothetical protein